MPPLPLCSIVATSLVVVLLTAYTAAALGRDVQPCTSQQPPINSSGSTTIVTINNTGGLNYVRIAACNAEPPSPTTCTPSAVYHRDDSALTRCEPLLPPNDTSYVNITFTNGALTMVAVQYFSSRPFSWHSIESSPSILQTWPPPGGRGIVTVPYPSAGAILCDSADDCPTGVDCVLTPPPSRCRSSMPSPPPSPLPPAPAPSASPAPAAVLCNLTSTLWEQSALSSISSVGSGRSADAFIEIVSIAPTGHFSWSCEASHKPCPGNTSKLNGTGVLSPLDSSFVLTPTNTSVGPIAGHVNSTYTCNVLTLSGGLPSPLQWAFPGRPVSTPFDTRVALATFMGGGGVNNTQQFVASGVAVLSAPSAGPALIVVAGNGPATLWGVPPLLLLGALPTDNGTIVVISVDAQQSQADVNTTAGVLRTIKVGSRLDHLRTNAGGRTAIAGSFGVAVLEGLAGASSSVVWHDALLDVEPGSCGVCCSSTGPSTANITCRVDIGDDGVVAVRLAVQAIDGEGWLWAAYSPNGTRFVQRAERGVAALTDVFVNSARAQTGVATFRNDNTGHEPMVMPAVAVFNYNTASAAGGSGSSSDVRGSVDGNSDLFASNDSNGGSISGSSSSSSNRSSSNSGGGGSNNELFAGGISLAYEIMPWGAHVYREPGPCDGNVADARIEAIRAGGGGRGGTLLIAGRSDGGNSPFACGLRNVTRQAPLVQLDAFTSPYNMQSQAISNFLVVDADAGEATYGQQQLTRLPSGNTHGNTLITLAAQSDDAGTVYLLQAAACCIANMPNLTVNGFALAGWVDAAALLVLSGDLATRYHWTHFSLNGTGGGSAPVDIDVRGSVVAFVLNANSGMVQVGALPGTSDNVGGVPVGYLVVMPTVVAV